MLPSNSALINAVAANANINSTIAWADKIVRASFQVSTTGTAAGSLQVQVSNDIAVGAYPNKFIPTNWGNLGSALSVTTGPAVFFISETEMSYEYIRVVYTDSTSGAATGTITVRMKSMSL